MNTDKTKKPSSMDSSKSARKGQACPLQACHFINGEPFACETDRELAVECPEDGSNLATLHPADSSTVDRAVDAAANAFVDWGTTPVKERVQPLFRFKSLVEARIDDLSDLVSRENGKTRAESRAGIEKGIEVVEYACSLPQLMPGEILEVSRGVNCHSRRFPLGVVAGITPFNFPAMVPLWMFPLAIASGNTFILKPSEQVPLTSLRMAELLQEAGLPNGVFNVVQGDRATVECLLDHSGIKACAFVGSTPVAKAVYQRGSAAGKRMLTLGGAKNHLVAMPDADIDIAARNIVNSFAGCAGQRCMAASVLIAVGECDALIRSIVEHARSLKPGDNLGAIISAKARDRIVGYIDQAEKDGAALLLDGRKVSLPKEKENGYYVGPTIIDGVSPDSPYACDEIFGPVLTILRAPTLDAALAIENASPYGNAASIYTSSGAIARHFEQRASAGMIGVNIGVPVPREPFSFGGWNDSKFGIGDITGRDSLNFWTRTKKVTEKWTASSSKNWMS